MRPRDAEAGGRLRLGAQLEAAREPAAAVEVAAGAPVRIGLGPDHAGGIEGGQRRDVVVERRRGHEQAVLKEVLIDAAVDGLVAIRTQTRVAIGR